ncbi:MAG: hypothetical protein FJX74_15190 [Armatimonadetes bacterium]|nr:hypothetical protein [Armatimonadota bacterium]
MAEIAVKTIKCDACGASITGISTWKPSVCDYCGSEVIVELPAASMSAVAERPRCVGFRLDAAQAGERLRAWLKSSFWSPGDLAATARTDEQAAIYVPAWEAQVEVETAWQGARSETRHRRVSKTRTNPQTGQTERYEEDEAYQEWYPASGTRQGSYAEVINASGALTQDEVSALMPWDTGAEAMEEDLADALNRGRRMEEPSVGAEEAVRRAREIIEGRERSECQTLIERLDSASTRFGEFLTQRVIVPVWVFRYNYKGKVQRAVMNGQTGELHGERPVSGLKVALAIGIPLAVIAAIVIVSMLMK